MSLTRLLYAASAGIVGRDQRRAVRDICDLLRTCFPELAEGPPLEALLPPLGELAADTEALAKSIFGLRLRPLSRDSPCRVTAFLCRAAARDFAKGRLVVVDGWYLSQTEARLMALMAGIEGRSSSVR